MTLLKILMKRDNLSKAEALAQIEEMQQAVLDGENPEELLYDIGLEPDYVFDILPLCA
jgi:hypothetical protein